MPEPARFRLRGKHYLNVPGTEWEYEETSRETGKKVRKRFPVPLFLDPDNPTDQNYPNEIIVAVGEHRRYPKDLIFLGPPTPDMEPLNDAADELVATCAPFWKHPIDDLPGSYSQSILVDLQNKIDALSKAGIAPAPSNSPAAGVVKTEFDDLVKQVEFLLGQNQELQAQIAALAAVDEPVEALEEA